MTPAPLCPFIQNKSVEPISFTCWRLWKDPYRIKLTDSTPHSARYGVTAHFKSNMHNHSTSDKHIRVPSVIRNFHISNKGHEKHFRQYVSPQDMALQTYSKKVYLTIVR